MRYKDIFGGRLMVGTYLPAKSRLNVGCQVELSPFHFSGGIGGRGGVIVQWLTKADRQALGRKTR